MQQEAQAAKVRGHTRHTCPGKTGEGGTTLSTTQRQLGGRGEALNALAVVEEDELEAERWLRGPLSFVSL